MNKLLSSTLCAALAITGAAVLGTSSGCTQLPGPGKVDLSGYDYQLRDMKYPSGLRVLVESDPGSEHVVVATVIGVGSAQDPKGKEGIAHVIEHLAFRAKHDGKASTWNRLDHAGAAKNASTSFDLTTYYSQTTRDQLPELLKLEAGRLLNPIVGVSDDTFRIEREVVRSELRQNNEIHAGGAISARLQALLFPEGHPYSKSIIGTHESLTSTTLEDARQHAAKYYRPDNTTIVLSGNIDLASAHELIAAAFPEQLLAGSGAPIVAHEAAAEPPATPAFAGPPKIETDVALPQVWLGWTLPASTAEDRFNASLAIGSLNANLGRGMFRQTAGVRCSLWEGAIASMAICVATLREDGNHEKIAKRLIDQVYRTWTPPDPRYADVYDQQNRLVSTIRFAIRNESQLSRTMGRARSLQQTGDPTMFSKTIASIQQSRSVTSSKFAAKYLTRDRARYLFVSPTAGTLTGSRATPEVPEGKDHSFVEPSHSPADVVASAVSFGTDKVETYELENGLKVILKERHNTPLVSMKLAMPGGTNFPGERGTGAFVDAFASRTRFEYGSAYRDYGASLRTSVSAHAMTISASSAANNLPNMMSIARETINSMDIDRASTYSVKEHSLSIIDKHENRPLSRGARDLDLALLGDHPYANAPLTKDWVGIGKMAGKKWMRQVIVPEDAVLVVVGDIEPEETKTQIERWFGSWRGQASVQTPKAVQRPTPADSQGPVDTVIRISGSPGATQASVNLGCTLAAAGVAESSKYALLSKAVQMWLYNHLRAKMGVTYGFHGNSTVLRGGTSLMTFGAYIDAKDLTRSLSAIRGVWESFDQLDDDLIERARWAVASSHSRRNSSNSAAATSLLYTELMGWPLESIDQTPAMLAAVTKEDLAIAFEHCRKHSVLSITGDKKVVTEAIAQGWEVPTGSAAEPASSDVAAPAPATPAPAPAPAPGETPVTPPTANQ